MAKPCQEQNSGHRGKMNRLKTPIIFSLCLFTLLSCGIEEYYYLPQVPESSIERILNNEARIDTSGVIDPTPTGHYYATGYIIYYKIYISSSNNADTPDGIMSINSRIRSDYNSLSSYTDPANSSSIPSLTTFSSRGFYELELYFNGKNIIQTVLSRSGGTFKIFFPLSRGVINPSFPSVTGPYIESGGNLYSLYRSNGNGAFNPIPTDRYFFSSPELKDYANATPRVNADVSGESGVSEYAHALMYIVTVGTNPNTFSRIYGKPTFINIFELTPN